MTLLSITPFGWAFILTILLSILLTRSVVRRTSPNEAPGCLSYLFIGFVISSSMIFVLSLSYVFFTKPKYKAKIISFTSKWEEHQELDNGKSTTIRTLMHTPTVQFISEEGRTITVQTNTSSGGKPVVGDYITVAYAPGDEVAYDLSMGAIVFVLVGILLVFIMNIILIAIFQYARGADPKEIKDFTVGFIIRLLVACGMLFLLFGMSYALWQYFAGKKDMPL